MKALNYKKDVNKSFIILKRFNCTDQPQQTVENKYARGRKISNVKPSSLQHQYLSLKKEWREINQTFSEFSRVMGAVQSYEEYYGEREREKIERNIAMAHQMARRKAMNVHISKMLYYEEQERLRVEEKNRVREANIKIKQAKEQFYEASRKELLVALNQDSDLWEKHPNELMNRRFVTPKNIMTPFN